MPAMQSVIFTLIAGFVVLLCLGFGTAIMFGVFPWINRLRGISTERSRIGWKTKIVGSIAIGIILSVMALTFMFSTKARVKKSPTKAFQMVFKGQIPESVVVLEFQHISSFDKDNIRLHFTIAPKDLKGILKSEG